MQAFLAAQGLHGLQAFFAAQGLQPPQPFLAAQGLQPPQPFLAAQGLQAFFAAQGLQAPQPFFAAQGLQPPQPFLAAHGLQAAAVIKRGMAHFMEVAAPPPQGLQAPQALFAPQGLQPPQPFLAAQGLQAPQPFLAAQGLQPPQPFLAAHGLQAPQPFLAAQGLQAPQPFFLAPQGLQAANRRGAGVAGALGDPGCWPRATAVGLTPWRVAALALVGAAANATCANGMALPAARAAPMTKGNTDAVKILFLVDFMIRPPASIVFDDFCSANVHRWVRWIRVTSPQTSVKPSGHRSASSINIPSGATGRRYG
ncbi:MAG: hypothetical protein HN732_02250 [Rhodospirillaceae bacterium]|nr:hypothetical protein [Rhodospirillaceae bacterium]